MQKHEQFEELCAAASIGQATPEEVLELEQHASGCQACRQRYFDYRDMAARQLTTTEPNSILTPHEAQEALNSDRLIQRFFARAKQEGIMFSRAVGREADQPVALRFRRQFSWRIPAFAAAVAAFAIALPTGYFYGKGSFHPTQPSVQQAAQQAQNNQDRENQRQELHQQVSNLSDTNAALQARIGNVEQELKQANARVSAREHDREVMVEEREKLTLARDTLAVQLEKSREQLAQSQALAANAQQDLARLRGQAADKDATLIADQVKIHDLTSELSEQSTARAEEKELLAQRHDVTDLMGARNLHIVDVVDTDQRGKTRPAFGRVFFTEGKSLIFYAYDLNEAKIEKANYQYRVWAKKEGPEKQVKSLGIFYSDDHAQRRWVFKCEDPKILNDIDSVFVTLEPAGADPLHPKGSNLMYAYLRARPNHP